MSPSKAIDVLVVIGTRPEAIKCAPVILELRRRPERFACRVCVTAQHRELLDQALGIFDILPDYDLNVMTARQALEQVTARVIEGMRGIFERRRPGIVLVQGDTTSVFATALEAFYHQIPICHIEAGLRSGRRYDPFPEEMNRAMVSVLADLHFAPTERARRNLLACGVPDETIHVTGNTVIDALLATAQREYEFKDGPLARIDWKSRRVILLTAHRRENFGEPMRAIFRAVRTLTERYPDVEVVFPVHPNPNVVVAAHEVLSGAERVHLISPIGYLPFVHLMKRSTLVLTDSGGLQEEAPSLGKPVLVLRRTTERPEGIEAGTASLVGVEAEAIVAKATQLLDDPSAYAAMANAVNPYGDGQAAERICNIIERWFARKA